MPALSACWKDNSPPYHPLVLGAGPSLDHILPFAAEIAERCVIIAVDTALAALARHAIQPDFAVVIDPQYWNSRHLDRVAPGGTVPICESSVNPRALRLLGSLPLVVRLAFSAW